MNHQEHIMSVIKLNLKAQCQGQIQVIIEIPTYSLVTITIAGAGADDVKKRADENNKEAMFQNFAPVTYCIRKINNTEIVNVKDIDVLMPMYSLI